MVFVDGFAGPGEYQGGQDGSPVIALKTLRDHAARGRFRALVSFLFIEENAEVLNHLRSVTAPLLEEMPQVSVQFIQGRFDGAISGMMQQIRGAGMQLAPAFVMVDPFGVSQTPMAVLRELLASQKCELLVSFMWEWINRFQSTSAFAEKLNALFGTDRWREAFALPTPREQREALFQIYRHELYASGARYVVRFDLRRGNRLIYSLFFATKSAKGCDLMKQAIWQVDPAGGYSFSADQQGFVPLFGDDLSEFQRELRAKFGGLPDIAIEALTNWAKTDETHFHSGQVKRALRGLEEQGLLTASRSGPRRAGQYPAGTFVRLAPR